MNARNDNQRTAGAARIPAYLYVERPKCPSCGGHRLRAYKSRSESDGSVTRYAICQDCERRVVIVVE